MEPRPDLDLREPHRLGFETSKQLTTLNAGSIVVIGTFLSDIFPHKHGTLAVGLPTKLLIAAAFVFFCVSLLTAAHNMGRTSTSLAQVLAHQYQASRAGEDFVVRPSTRRTALLAVTWDLAFFVAGILVFSLAVLLSLF